jgi:hypothetical protein
MGVPVLKGRPFHFVPPACRQDPLSGLDLKTSDSGPLLAQDAPALCRLVGLHVSLFVIEPCGCPHPYFLEQADQFCSFAGSQYGHGFFHVHRVLLEGSLD